MIKVGLYFKYGCDGSELFRRTVKALGERGVEYRLVNDCGELAGLDVLMVFGGDGTILNIAAKCAELGVKIIGINYGHLGFLAEFEPEKLDEAIDIVCSGRYSLQE